MAGTTKRRVNAYRAWLLAGLYLLLEFVVLLTRVQVTGVAAIGAEYRYFTDFALVAALAVGLRRCAPGRSWPAAGRSAAHQLGARGHPAPDRGGVRDRTAGRLRGVLGTFGERWTATRARVPGQRAAGDRPARAGRGDLQRPGAVLWSGGCSAGEPADEPARPGRAGGPPLETGMSTRRLFELSKEGRLQDCRSAARCRGRAAPGCGWSVGTGPTGSRSTPRSSPGTAVQLDLVTPTATTLTVRAGDTSAEVPVAAAGCTSPWPAPSMRSRSAVRRAARTSA